MNQIDYISLVKKSDGKEVYSSPKYTCGGLDNMLDIKRIQDALLFYFKRVNSGIEQQMSSQKLSEEQKKNLKLLDLNDYLVKFVQLQELGCNFQKTYWQKEASEFLKN